MEPGSTDALAFTQLLLTVIDEGRRTATYKLAVLLALIDCCASASDADGRPPRELSTRALTRRVVELYWPQLRPYGGDALRQSSQPNAVTVEAILKLRAAAPGAATLAAAERMAPAAARRCLNTVELNLVRMPLGKLQRPSTYSALDNPDYPRFLYDDTPFHEQVTRRQLDAQPLVVRLRDNVGDYLVSLAGLLRPLVELHWTRDIVRFNRISPMEEELRKFLFGASRIDLAPVRPGLLDLQHGRCFYCDGNLRADDVHVDHFVPWSRIPNDALANLVLADRRCNETKSDNYADVDLLQRWAERPRPDLTHVADAVTWPLRFEESFGIARSLYAHLPAGTRLWSGARSFRLLDPDQLSAVLPALGA